MKNNIVKKFCIQTVGLIDNRFFSELEGCTEVYSDVVEI